MDIRTAITIVETASDREHFGGWATAPGITEVASDPETTHYIRFGDIPKDERSEIGTSPNIYAHSTRRSNKEKGVSVFDTARKGRRWNIVEVGNHESLAALLVQKRPAYLVTGRRVGTGIDGEPVLRDVTIVQQLRYSQLYVPGWGADGYPDKA
jgi:hypothetical protein